MADSYRGLATFSPDRQCSDLELAGLVGLGCVCYVLVGICWAMQLAGDVRRRLRRA